MSVHAPDDPGRRPERGVDDDSLATEPDRADAHWLAHVYQGDRVPQLTVRALVLGAMLGSVTGLSNLYVGLKTGYSVGVVVTASVMGWAIWTVLMRLSVAKRPLTILELNAMASTASAAGYSTGVNLMSAIAAYVMVVGHHLPFIELSLWVLSVALLGVFVAIPMKRQMIDIERLPFPTGRAAAEMLRGLHASGADGARRAKALFTALTVGVAIKWATSGMHALARSMNDERIAGWALPETLPTPAMMESVPWLAAAFAYTWAIELSTLLVAAGAIMGWRVCWSLLLGAVSCYGIVAPRLHVLGVIEGVGYASIVQVTLWTGVAIMVVSGLALFLWQWRTILRAFAALRAAFVRTPGPREGIARVQVPIRHFIVGTVMAGTACVVLQWAYFDIPPLLGSFAVVLAFLLAVVAARVTGEADLTPTGPLGKIAQLGFGGLMPGQSVPNLMAASVTAGASASAADLLTDLKSGHVLGANPRKQFWAQFIGVFVGVAVTVPVFRFVLVPSPEALGTAQWPAPAARVWRSVAVALSEGLGSLHPITLHSLWLGALVGLVLVVADRSLPRARPYIPSATGLGLAFILPAFQSLSFFFGGLAALLLARRWPGLHARYTIAVAAGLIAGESLMGIIVAILQA